MLKFATSHKYDIHLLELDENNIVLTKNPDGPHFVSYGSTISYEDFKNGSLNELVLEIFGSLIFELISTISEVRKLSVRDTEPLERTYFWERKHKDSIFRLNCDGVKLFLSEIDETQKKEKMSFPLEHALFPENNKILLVHFGTELHEEIIQTIKNILIKRIFDA